MSGKKPTKPGNSKLPKPTVKEEPESDEEFSVENLCTHTAVLSVREDSNQECPSSPFGCPMSPKWELWLTVKIRPNKDCMIRTGESSQFNCLFY